VKQKSPLSPARLQPIFVPRIWGAKSLAPLFSEKTHAETSSPDELPIGEVWLTENKCCFAEGPYAGRTLAEAWQTMPPEWAGTSMAAAGAPTTAFPLLAKFLFPGDKLSVQVHPPDEYAKKHEAASGGVGKTEMWYALAAQPSSEVFVGLKPGVTRQVFRRAIDEGTAENCLMKVPVHAQDAVFIPAGTAHTVGSGLVLCEIQQSSDVTYRVFDYGRRQPDGTFRALHVNQAMDVMNFDKQRGGKVSPARAKASGAEITHLVACRYFAVEKWQFAKQLSLTSEPEHFELWIVLSGKGRISWPAAPGNNVGHADYSAGEAWFVPASLGKWRIEPAAKTEMLRAFVPDLDVYAAQLTARGISSEAAARIIHR
jgi:mannose-6-phosphate isomerase